MNIQIFGKSKCFDTKKAQRYFKERRVKFQAIDLNKYGISKGELTSVLRSVKLPDLIDDKHPDAALLEYLAYDQDKIEKLLEDPTLLGPPSSATASRPPSAISRTFGRGGSEHRAGSDVRADHLRLTDQVPHAAGGADRRGWH